MIKKESKLIEEQEKRKEELSKALRLNLARRKKKLDNKKEGN
ncbi:hypothetical protein Cyrtocomes_00542 [Candidatus Cyrtobacter comes]|uniref:Uncharacterized protein n=1 Tax=Candidatus Cyrtobacter comes TaxID=675776 RepID=A0ABU5L7S3_9RICK|nr:hypothetical protein [Candidatus Cyrtobacter comes]MDZ5762171.1 hypothetical protein [Candidatus Cyrtobacter comes]